LIAAQPWQEIIGPPKQKVTAIGSSRPSTSSRHGPMKRYRTLIRVYVKREGDHYLVSCITTFMANCITADVVSLLRAHDDEAIIMCGSITRALGNANRVRPDGACITRGRPFSSRSRS
jgi:hypothetical protein